LTSLFQSVVTIGLFILILGALVLIHELGHFVTARAANVRVLEFGIGFPPRAKVLANRGETVYTLNYLPIGGFVKLEGEDGTDADDPRSFSSQGLPLKLLILVAGVVMNIALAFVIFTGIALGGDPTIGVSATTIQPGSPAAAAGLQPGDVIVSLNGNAYGAFAGTDPVTDLRSHAGETVTLGIKHAVGTTSEVTATLRTAEEIAAGQGALGIGQPRGVVLEQSITYTPVEAVKIGAQRTVDALGLIVGGLAKLGEAIVNRPTEAPPVAGPIGIATQIGDVFWKLGPIYTLYVTAILSANLAIVNILPFPPLDGGRMLMITLKRFFGSRISVRAERLTYMVGFVFLFAFLIWVTGFDIARGLGGGS
jgi:regulator of sigma E protease